MVVANTGIYYIDPLLMNQSWTGSSGIAAAIPFSYGTDAASTAIRSLATGNLNEPAYKLAAQLAMATWQQYANIQFTPYSGAGNAPLLIGHTNYTLDPSSAGVTYFYDAGSTLSEVDLIVGLDEGQRLIPGQYGFFTLLHEFGHALGLDHPFETETTPLPTALQNWNYTIMSYSEGAYVNYSNLATTPMLYDVATIQYLYGANMTTNSSDGSVHTLRSGQSAYTVWDAGGSGDVVDAASNNGAVLLDLREGENNVNVAGTTAMWIAFGSSIENATGGSGADTIQGNATNNVLTGNAGADLLYGFTGSDQLLGGQGADQLFGGQGDDTLQGGQGNDQIFGNLTNDSLYGNLGNDTLRGGQGDDQLFGDDGDDWLYGDRGNDVLSGGAGADRFIFENNLAGNDILLDFVSGQDKLQLSSNLFGSADLAFTALQNGTLTFAGGGQVSITGNVIISDILIG